MADQNVIQVVIRARDEASAELKKLDGNLRAVALAVSGISAAATGLTLGLYKIAESAAKNGEEMLAFSQKIGISVEQTTRLKYAAEQSETSLEVMRVGLRFLQKNAAEAGGALADLGIKGKTTRDLLLSAANVFSKMAEGPAKAALAIKVFGRAGTEMLPLLNAGAAGIEALEKRADDLKITMSSTAAVMGDEFNDSLATVKAQIDGLKTRIASALLPTLIEYAGRLSEIIVKTSEWAEANQPLITANFKVAAAVAGVVALFSPVIVGLASVRAAVILLGASLNPLLALALALAGAAVANFVVGVQAAREKLRVPLTVQVEFAGGGLEQAKGALEQVKRQVALLQDEKLRLEKAIPAAKTSQGYATPQSIALEGQLESVNARLEVQQKDLARVNELYRGFSRTSTDAAAELGKVSEAQKEAVVTSSDLLAAVERQDRAYKEFHKTLSGLSLKGTIAPEVEAAAAKVGTSTRKPTLAVSGELPENANPEEATTGFQEWAQAVGLTSKAVEELNGLMAESGPIIAGVAAGFEAFREQAAIAFDLTANVADVAFRGMMDLVDNAGEVFGKFFDDVVFKGQNAFAAFGNFIVGVGKLVESIVKQILVELAKAIAKAIVVKIITTALLSEGGTVAFARGGTVRMSTGGSLPQGGGFAPAAPPLLRGASGFTVPGAVQVFDTVPALLAPGEAVLPTINGRRPADIVSRMESMETTLASALKELARTATAKAPTMVNIQAFNLDSLREMLRSGDLRREQLRAFDLGRA